jgi:hypothetical protein
MNQADTNISLLKLQVNVKKNQIFWYFAPISNQSVSPVIEPLNLSDITRRTIKFLVEQLQLLANMVYTANKQPAIQMPLLHYGVDTTTSNELIRILGEHLYYVLFKGEILEKLDIGLHGNFLRVELEFEDDDEAASWPWEYLYRPKDQTLESDAFLVQIAQLVLNRRLYLKNAPPISLGVTKPVKLLLVVSRPTNEGEVVYDMILEKIKELHEKRHVIDSRVLIDYLDRDDPEPPNPDSLKATADKFKKLVDDFHPNIIHFIGHGQRSGKHGQIAFLDDNGRSQWIDDDEFADIATQHKDELKLVFLQACDSAHNSISGMTQRLAYKNIPAVIAMQYKIGSNIANIFARGFYDALAEGKAVDMAVKAGRHAIKAQKDEELPHAFGLPVLYLSSYDSFISNESVYTSRPTSPGQIAAPNWYTCPNCNKDQPKQNSCIQCRLIFKCIYCGMDFDSPNDKELFYCGSCAECVRCLKCKEQLRKVDMGFELCMNCRNIKEQDRAVDSRPIAGATP